MRPSAGRLGTWISGAGLIAVVALAGCGDSSGVERPLAPPTGGASSSSSASGAGGSGSSSGSTSGSTSSSTSGSSSSGASFALGERQFAIQCENCHDVTDRNLVKNYNLEQLTAAIDDSMPLGSPSACVETCAAAVAAYIADENPFFGSAEAPPLHEIPAGVEPAIGTVDAAPTAIRRLNRAEYNNSVRDLFGTQLQPADNFPEDDFGYGFNNIAKVLSASLTHLEQHLLAADQIVEEALGRAFAGQTLLFEAEYQTGTQVQARESTALLNRGDSVLRLTLPVSAAGRHRLSVRAGQQAGGADAAQMTISVDGIEIATQAVAAAATAMARFDFDLNLSSGDHALAIAFTNDFWIEGEADRNLVLDWISLTHNTARDTRVISCDPNTGLVCARATIAEFGLRTWRRPLTTAEIDQLLALYNTAADTRAGFGQILRALLLSPNFIYRTELDTALTSAAARPLTAFELASRLSYFLWSSTPDAPLLALAEDGSLTGETVLRGQVARMLDDPKAATLIEQFAVQWLKFDKVLEADPAAQLFPRFDQDLVAAMRQESRLFLFDWLHNNQPVSALLTADYSFLNGPLAAHYGVSAITGNDFIRHPWQSEQRRGLLGHAAILTATSHPSNTSPVRRGVWVLENLLCQAPPPPPPGVENLADDNLDGLTTRERFELHRDSSSVCYSCHAMMDPIGFGLENFDAIGAWRSSDAGQAVDASGVLPSGETFSGPLQLSQALAQSPRLPLCVTQHLMTYALGRGVEAMAESANAPEPPDYPAVYQVYERTRAGGHRIRDIIAEIVMSEAFRFRRGADSERENL